MDKPFPAYKGDEPFVFVCYAHEDAAVVYPELAWLHDHGVNVWYDEGISAGRIWREEIGDAIKGASHVLYYISESSLASDHCDREINFALDQRKNLLPVYLEEVALTTDLEVGLSRVQALHRNQDASYQQHLLNALGQTVEVVPPSTPPKPEFHWRRSILMGLVAIVFLGSIGIIYLILDNDVIEPLSGTVKEVTPKSIAVLPFMVLSSGEDDGYFADGLAEEILNALAQVPELLVIARTSSFFFKGQNTPVPEIATRLGVSHIVEGSVRRDGDRVRITAQLIRASDGFSLWSQRYNRTLDDVFAVQEDIAENIAEALDVVLDDNARKVMRGAGIRDVEAFIAYQKGVEAFAMAHTAQSLNSSEPLTIANVHFDRALEAAPGLIVARILKADRAVHVLLEIATRIRDEAYPGEEQDALAELKEEYDLAWRLSPPGNQRDILDVERTMFSEDWSRLPDLIQKAMKPGECPQMNYFNQLVAPFGWAEKVAEKMRETLACNPMDPFSSAQVAFSLIMAGDPAAALQTVEEAESKGLSHPWLEDARYWALLAAGRIDEPGARGAGAKNSIMRYDRQILREALVGDPATAKKMAEQYWSQSDTDDTNSLWLAAAVGDRQRANKLAARIDAYPGNVVTFNGLFLVCFCGAPFDLEATPNFKARIEEAGFPWPPVKRIDYPAKTW